MVEPTEDIPYTVSDFATPDEEQVVDVDRPHKSVLVKISESMAADIARHKSFDILQLPSNATPEQKAAVFDEIAIHKGLAMYLEKYKADIDKKIKELG